MRFACYRLHILLSGALALNVSIVLAQDYPTRPVRLITSGIGGGTDFSARMIAQGLTEAPLGQPVVVDNRSSAQASDTVSKAPPDGHVLLLVAGNLWIGPLLTKMPYDPIKDFVAISITNRSPNILAVHPSLPVKTVKDLIALDRRSPGQINFASASTGGMPHLAGELFNSMTGTKLVHIPYKGAAPATTDLLSGQVTLMFNNMLSAMPQVKAGRLRAVAVTSSKRSAAAPELPTIAETVPGYEASGWYGAFAPAATSKELIGRLNAEMNRIMKMPDVTQRLAGDGVEAVGTTPEQFGTYLKQEVAKWGKVVKASGAKAD